MNAVENQVRELVKVELAAANERFPQFHSAHEGWAVILEEVNELSEEIALVEKTAKEMWEHIKNGRALELIRYDADWINKYAINAACEAIQVAAMCKKFLDMGGSGMKKSKIEIGAVYSNGKGCLRKVIDRGDYPLYQGQEDRDDILYEIVNDGTKKNSTAGKQSVMTASSFSKWAKGGKVCEP